MTAPDPACPTVVAVELPYLGNRCHLVHDGRVALVVDPPRDLGPVERAAEDAGVEIAAVADTHVHNDYLSGALALARRHGADYLLSADESVEFERVGVRGGDLVPVGALEIRVLDTPGHTRHHQSFLASTTAGPGALFSGGSMLHGTVGRTDLVDAALTYDLARAQWGSARSLATLPAATALHPTHGFGSFCASAAVPSGTREGGTLADEAAANPALLEEREAFVDALVAGFGPIPAHYRHMAPLNRAGSGRRDPRPSRRLSVEELLLARDRGAWLVDLRHRRAHAAGHLPGSVGVEYSDQFATYVGWVVPWGAELVLLSDSPAELTTALRDLAAIGIEGAATFLLDEATPRPDDFRVATWRELLGAGGATPPGVLLLDVRQRDEHAAGHLPGTLHVPVQDVPSHAAGLPEGEVWVYCRSGYRAGIAASLLHRAGRRVVHVDDDWARVEALAEGARAGAA